MSKLKPSDPNGFSRTHTNTEPTVPKARYLLRLKVRFGCLEHFGIAFGVSCFGLNAITIPQRYKTLCYFTDGCLPFVQHAGISSSPVMLLFAFLFGSISQQTTS